MNASPKHRPFGPATGILSGLLILAALAALPVQAAPSGGPDTPIAASRFGISIDGVQIASFTELTGITTEIPPETSGDLGRTMNVTLKRGLTRNMEMAAWHELVILGDVATSRKDVILTMYSESGAAVVRYHLTNAWPSKIEVSGLKDKSGVSVLSEAVTLTCEFIQRVQ